MEQETKYRIKDAQTAERIQSAALRSEFGCPKKSESVEMRAIYYDTESGILRKNGIALRLRKENDSCFATLKWGSKKTQNAGLHVHEEINIPIDSESAEAAPDPALFDADINGKKLPEITGGEKLCETLRMSFLRKRVLIENNESLMELSIDNGAIITKNGSLPIYEIEIELFEGDLQDVLDLAESIADKYGLEPEEQSKYSRGLEQLQR